MSEQQEVNVVADSYDNYVDTQKEVLAIELRRTRNSLFRMAAVLFAADLFALMSADLVMVSTIIVIAILPIVLVGLAFLAMKEPLIAMIIASILILALWIYHFYIIGGRAALMGWAVKAIIIYLILAGFQNAIPAMKIKKELKA